MLDKDIIKRCIEGDRKAQEKLYNFYASKMKAICLRYVKSSAEAEDVFQDGFIKVFTNLKNYKGEGSFDGWIRRIIVNTAVDRYKKNLPLQQHSNYEDISETEAIILTERHELEEQDLLKILNKLPDGYKFVFNMYAIEGYSHKEIGEMLNITESTSKSQLHRARKMIQELFFLQNTIRQ